jgi:ribose transport system substrate-binding protein
MSITRIRARAVAASLTGAAVALTLTACGHEGTSDNAASAVAKGGRPTVCMVMKSLGNQYFQGMQAAAIAHAKQRGDLVLQAVGVQSDTDVDDQVTEINKCITEGAAGLIIAPADSRALVEPLKRAVAAGMKVVNIDVQLDQGALKQAGLSIPFIGPDNTAATLASGMVLAKDLGGGGKVVILQGEPGAANAVQRTAGFMEAVQQGHLDLLASTTAHWDTDDAYTVLSDMLTAHPDIQGVLSSNDDMTLGAEKAIAAAHLTGKIKIASFDDIDAVRTYLADGSVVATVNQNAGLQADDGIDDVLNEIAGKATYTGWVKTPFSVVTTAAAAGGN